MKKAIKLLIVVACVLIILFLGIYYWLETTHESGYKSTQWIVESTKKLIENANKSDAKTIPDYYLHLYVKAALGNLTVN